MNSPDSEASPHLPMGWFAWTLVVVAAMMLATGCGKGDTAGPGADPGGKAAPTPAVDPADLRIINAAFTVDESTWDSETYDDHTIGRLKKILAYLNKPAEMATAADLKAMLADDFAAAALRPPVEQAEKLYDAGGMRVLRWERKSDASMSLQGIKGL